MLLLIGCAGEPAGPKLNDVTGKITFAGQSVPAGRIVFTPDTAQGGLGPQGFAEIHSGEFDTRRSGQGVLPGPMHVRISGYERPNGPPLFLDYEIELDLQPGDMNVTLDVPSSAAEGLPAPGAEMP